MDGQPGSSALQTGQGVSYSQALAASTQGRHTCAAAYSCNAVATSSRLKSASRLPALSRRLLAANMGCSDEGTLQQDENISFSLSRLMLLAFVVTNAPSPPSAVLSIRGYIATRTLLVTAVCVLSNVSSTDPKTMKRSGGSSSCGREQTLRASRQDRLKLRRDQGPSRTILGDPPLALLQDMLTIVRTCAGQPA